MDIRFVTVVKMDVSVNKQLRLETVHKLEKRLESPMGRRIGVSYPVRRGMCQKDVTIAAVLQPIQHELRDQFPFLKFHFTLGVLEGLPVVADGPFEPGDHESLRKNGMGMDVDTPQTLTLDMSVTRVFLVVMIAVNVDQRLVEHADDILEVRIWQVARGKDKVDIGKIVPELVRIDPIVDDIADDKDLHHQSFSSLFRTVK
jgi:hypothetical protein